MACHGERKLLQAAEVFVLDAIRRKRNGNQDMIKLLNERGHYARGWLRGFGSPGYRGV